MSAGQLWRGHLTPAEAEVVELVSRGDTNKQIAAELGVSDSTVKFHLTSAMKSIGVSTRTAAARWWWTTIELDCDIPAWWEGSS